MEVKSFDEILNDMQDYAVGHQDSVTDFNDGSIAKTILETVAREIERLYISTRNGFNNLLLSIPTSVFGFSKKEGVKASGVIKFSRIAAISTESIIAIGTRVKSGDLIYITTTEGKILANATQSNDVTIEAEKIGKLYNVAANTVNVIDGIVPPDVVSVTNASAIGGGIDSEQESQWGERFNDYINGVQGISKYGIKSKVLENVLVKDCKINDHFPPDNNNNNFTVVIDTGKTAATQEQINSITSLINGGDTPLNPGLNAPGTKFNVIGATIQTQNVVFKYKNSTTDENVEQDIKDVIAEYIDNLKIGESLYLCDLICRINHIEAVEDIQIVTPANNVILASGSNNVIKAGTITSTAYTS